MVVALLLTAVSPAAVARKFRTADAQDDPTVQARNNMAPLVAERTGGFPNLCNFHSWKLGEENDTIMQTPATAIDLDRTNVAPTGDEIPESFEPCGFVGTFYDSGARSIYVRDPATAEPIKRVGQTE
jgi:TRAP-type C4-dicarboxylate transport system substrate-binding protein